MMNNNDNQKEIVDAYSNQEFEQIFNLCYEGYHRSSNLNEVNALRRLVNLPELKTAIEEGCYDSELIEKLGKIDFNKAAMGFNIIIKDFIEQTKKDYQPTPLESQSTITSSTTLSSKHNIQDSQETFAGNLTDQDISNITEAYNLCVKKAWFKSNVLDKVNKIRELLKMPLRTKPLEKGQYDQEVIKKMLDLNINNIVNPQATKILSGIEEVAINFQRLTPAPFIENNDSSSSSIVKTITDTSLATNNQNEKLAGSSSKNTNEDAFVDSFVSKLVSTSGITNIFEIALNLTPDATTAMIKGLNAQIYSRGELAQVNALRNIMDLPPLLSVQKGFRDTEFLKKLITKITNVADVIEMVTPPKVGEQVLNLCSKINDSINSAELVNDSTTSSSSTTVTTAESASIDKNDPNAEEVTNSSGKNTAENNNINLPHILEATLGLTPTAMAIISESIKEKTYLSNDLTEVNKLRVALNMPPRTSAIPNGFYDSEILDEVIKRTEKADANVLEMMLGAGYREQALSFFSQVKSSITLTSASPEDNKTTSSSSTTSTVVDSSSSQASSENKDKSSEIITSDKNTARNDSTNPTNSFSTIEKGKIDLAAAIYQKCISGKDLSQMSVKEINEFRELLGFKLIESIPNGYYDDIMIHVIRTLAGVGDFDCIGISDARQNVEKFVAFYEANNYQPLSALSIDVNVGTSYVADTTLQQSNINSSSTDEKTKLQNIFDKVITEDASKTHDPDKLKELEVLLGINPGSLGDNLYGEVVKMVSKISFAALDAPGDEGMSDAIIMSCLDFSKDLAGETSIQHDSQ